MIRLMFVKDLTSCCGDWRKAAVGGEDQKQRPCWWPGWKVPVAVEATGGFFVTSCCRLLLGTGTDPGGADTAAGPQEHQLCCAQASDPGLCLLH